MNIVERIQQLPDCIIEMDENFRKLNDALDDYHRLTRGDIMYRNQTNIQGVSG